MNNIENRIIMIDNAKVFPVVLIPDGSAEHGAHIWSKSGISIR